MVEFGIVGCELLERFPVRTPRGVEIYEERLMFGSGTLLG